MRTIHSLRNIYINLFSQIVILVLGFISRKVFLDSLGVSYLGVNGLLTNILTMLTLVEGGIGISIVYNLYKPLANDDREKIIALIQLYKKAYMALAGIVLLISVLLYPFLGLIMKDSNGIENLTFIYVLFMLKTTISYLNAHKWSLINADQRGYILAKINLIYQILSMVAKIFILLATNNYILYLLIELILYTLQLVVNGRIVNKRYPYIKTKKKYFVDKETKQNLKVNVKALFIRNFGGFCVNGTDNILISSFISLATVGLYANYTMITQQLSALVSPILSGIGASVGNLLATESSDKNYSIFKISFLINFWIYSICVIFLYNLLEPFISWWLGEKYILNDLTFYFILVNFYINGLNTAITTFKNKAGLFVQDKYAPLFQGVINLLASIILLRYLGLAGIFLGTTISTLATVCWTQPFIVYKYVFNKSVRSYFARYFLYLSLTFISCIVTSIICSFIHGGDILITLIIKGLLSIFLPSVIFLLLFFKTPEFQYLKDIGLSVVAKYKMRRKIDSAS
ncbi:MAG: lipopolysaccharide biosynthesis protein [Heyndrickxia sp.]